MTYAVISLKNTVSLSKYYAQITADGTKIQRMQKNEANPRRHRVLKPRSDRTGSFPTPTSIYHKSIN